MNLAYDWGKDIVPYLDTIEIAAGGFTPAQRGVIRLADSTQVFVKIATSDQTAKWLAKEIKAYTILNDAQYAYIPKLLSVRPDNQAMAIEFLAQASFADEWDEDKLTAVCQAQDALKEHIDLFRSDEDFKPDSVIDLSVDWSSLTTPASIELINTRLPQLGAQVSVTSEQLAALSKELEGWQLHQDTLVHQDIRADNFGYDIQTKTGKLVDWNWLCIGDESLDRTPLFINMLGLGFDPYVLHPEKYDRQVIIFIMGYWLGVILSRDAEMGEQNTKLRRLQARNVQICLRLLNST